MKAGFHSWRRPLGRGRNLYVTVNWFSWDFGFALHFEPTRTSVSLNLLLAGFCLALSWITPLRLPKFRLLQRGCLSTWFFTLLCRSRIFGCILVGAGLISTCQPHRMGCYAGPRHCKRKCWFWSAKGREYFHGTWYLTDDALGWHFGGERLGFGDGRPVIVGETLKVDPRLPCVDRTTAVYPCRWGLHAGRTVHAAWCYIQGGTLRRVRLSGWRAEQTDKMCALERTVLWAVDARVVLTRTLAAIVDRYLVRMKAKGQVVSPASEAIVTVLREANVDDEGWQRRLETARAEGCNDLHSAPLYRALYEFPLPLASNGWPHYSAAFGEATGGGFTDFTWLGATLEACARQEAKRLGFANWDV